VEKDAILMELQHLNVKLFIEDGQRLDLKALVPVFHNWIQDQVCEELLLDVADYVHVPAGPGVVLIGHEANYSVDNRDHRLGVRYNRKAPLEGSNQDRLSQATQAALAACQRLEADRCLEGKVQFNGHDIEVFVNDRLLAPNSETSRQAADAEFRTFFRQLFAGGEFTLTYEQEPRKLFSAVVRASPRFDTAGLLDNLRALQAIPNRA
jgi:hypothetical protein